MSIEQFFISNISNDLNHEEALKDILQSAESVIVIAPFITRYGIDLLRSTLSTEATLKIITELNPRGIASGSQSPRLLKEISERPNTEVYFTTNGKLHSKIYFADDNVFITSGNLTQGGLKNNFETGILFSSKTKNRVSDKLKEEIISRLRKDLIPYIEKSAFKLNDSSIAPFIEFECSDKLREFKDFIKETEEELPSNGFATFMRDFGGRPVETEILASLKEFQLEEKYWDVFFRYKDNKDIDHLRNDLDNEINPILENIFHCIKQSPVCSAHFANLMTMFSRNLQVKTFLPTYRNMYLTKMGLNGDNRKKHVYYPSFVLNMSALKDQSEKIFQIRVGVEEDISHEPLCPFAKNFLTKIVINSGECITRFSQMNGNWFLVHGQDRKGKRVAIPLKDVTENQLKEICNSYLISNEPADINICHNYYWGRDDILKRPKEFIDSLASDLNHLSYFFELANKLD